MARTHLIRQQPAGKAETLRFTSHRVAGQAGTSFKPEHFAAILEDPPQQGFFEVHAENYMGAGGPAHAALESIRRDYPVSIHGVCMSLGGPSPLDPQHLERFRILVERYEPAMVSEHLAWSTHENVFFNDLLPLPYNLTTLLHVCEHVDRMQSTIGRRIFLENPSTYVAFDHSTISETDFLAEVVRRTGCGLLLDVNNVFVSAANHRFSPITYLETFPLAAVGEVHLAGHAEQVDSEGQRVLIDSHDGPVADAVWQLYETIITRCGPVPTLIEWDSEIPDWPVLRAEALAAQEILDRHGATGQVRDAAE
jgi:hypothetical protein